MKKPTVVPLPSERTVIEVLHTPSGLDEQGRREIAAAMNTALADVFALYLKTKNFHWHMNGPHFRDYHLLLDEQSEQILAMSDPIAERVRKLGQLTLKSIGEVARLQRVQDSDDAVVEPGKMLAELQHDNQQLAAHLRQAHELCGDHGDVATASLLEAWIDETERRSWFLFETGQQA